MVNRKCFLQTRRVLLAAYSFIVLQAWRSSWYPMHHYRREKLVSWHIVVLYVHPFVVFLKQPAKQADWRISQSEPKTHGTSGLLFQISILLFKKILQPIQSLLIRS